MRFCFWMMMMMITMENAIAVPFSCLFIHEIAPRFAPLDRACKD
jgi:hypothetical protein